MSVLILSLQAPFSLALKGTTLPLQGPTAGPREAEVEGPRAFWQVLKKAETDPMSYQSLPTPFTPAVTTKSFSFFFFLFFLVNCWKCFFFYSLFLRRACVAFSIKQICNSALAPLVYLNINLFLMWRPKCWLFLYNWKTNVVIGEALWHSIIIEG